MRYRIRSGEGVLALFILFLLYEYQKFCKDVV